MNAYERQVLQQWVKDDQLKGKASVRLAKSLTGRLGRIVKMAAKQETIAKGMDKLRDVARQAVFQVLEQAATAKQLERVEMVTQSLGAGATTASELRMLPLEVKDQISRQLTRRQTAVLSTQGAAAGFAASVFELVPGLQGLVIPTIIADLFATVYLMAQSAVQIGYSYGYSLHNPDDIPHFLFAMAPYDPDANILEAKLALHVSMKKGSLAPVAQLASHEVLRPLADRIAARIAANFMEQRLGVLIPVAGALLQGSLNAVFAESSYKSAKRYFQRQHFIDRYGEVFLEQCLDAVRQQSATVRSTSPAYQTS